MVLTGTRDSISLESFVAFTLVASWQIDAGGVFSTFICLLIAFVDIWTRGIGKC